MFDDYFSVSLFGSDHNQFTDRTSSPVQFLGKVFVGFLSSDEGFIHFHYTVQLLLFIFHPNFPDSVTEEPGGLLSDSKFF